MIRISYDTLSGKTQTLNPEYYTFVESQTSKTMCGWGVKLTELEHLLDKKTIETCKVGDRKHIPLIRMFDILFDYMDVDHWTVLEVWLDCIVQLGAIQYQNMSKSFIKCTRDTISILQANLKAVFRDGHL